jgi:acetyl-CoA C-acetyltransferase
MEDVLIVEGMRTAVGGFGGTLKDIPAVELGARVIAELLARTGIPADKIDEVIMGNVLQAGLGQNTARQAAIGANIPVEVPAFTVNKVCGSGLKAVTLAAQSIASGDADIVIAGGMENMSRAPYLLREARWGCRMGTGELVDSMVSDGLWCALGDYHMGMTAENIAERFGISRRQQDEFAALSQHKAARAIESGVFEQEIAPISIPQRKADPVVFKTDEHPRPGTTVEKLAALGAAFKPDGTVTAGNSSGINDGAAAVLLVSEKKACELSLKAKVRIRGYACAGVDPAIMGTGPIAATKKALNKTGLAADDLDLVEANEAFAVQAIAVSRELGWDESKINVNGGAVAYGHPIGATGAKLMVNLIYEMQRRDSSLGLVTLCIGGGQGIAVIVQRQS